ncbi:hypothetical protein FHW68_003654 [Pseudomonas sp. Tn43]|uniref:hypothetical protein n=1 Tax=unclassified Pseudomonas TaxID=196821 RepID=UPI00143D2441|nr:MULTISPECIES: hypothetical protein [unclassified Pseudomonas]MBB3242117.1 hypothetical protein [Pseudomonas sp. Tn43]
MKPHYVPVRSAGRINGFFLGFLAIAAYFLLNRLAAANRRRERDHADTQCS